MFNLRKKNISATLAASTAADVKAGVGRDRAVLTKICDDIVQSEDLWERAGQIPIKEEIGKRKWRRMCHTLRKPKSNITTKQSLRWNPQGNRVVIRPRET